MKPMGSAVVLVAACTAAASANITYNSQIRSIEKSVLIKSTPYSESVSTNALGDWNESISGGFGDINGFADAYASQISSLGANSISASGTMGGSYGPPAGTSIGTGFSYLAVSFTLDQAMDYTLDLDMFTDHGQFSFTGTSINLVGNPWDNLQISQSGTLQAGTYDLIIDAGVSGGFVQGDYAFDLQLVPAPSSAGMLGLGLLAATRRRR